MSVKIRNRTALVCVAVVFFCFLWFLPEIIPFDTAVLVATFLGMSFGAWLCVAWISGDFPWKEGR